MKKFIFLFGFLFLLLQNPLLHVHAAEIEAQWLVKKSSHGDVVVQPVQRLMKHEGQKVKSLPEYIAKDNTKAPDSLYEEFLYSDKGLPNKYRNFISIMSERPWFGSEVRTLVDQGPTSNRIDLTIVGDGYTTQEKEKFFQDAERLTENLFGGQAFSSYLPLFNVHAVFVPSQESGLTDENEVNTALGLYRSPPGSKRGILPGNTRAIERALGLAPDTDYPILVANDEYYGGLGGRYAITTRSLESGAIVLLHELGHNFGEVGEEYDGGQVYSGANSSRSGATVPWAHWIDGSLNTFESQRLTGDYVWKNLSAGPYRANFVFPRGDYILDVIVSSVGWATPEDVHIKIGSEKQTLHGKFTRDRSFFNIHNTLEPGTHEVTAKENIADGDNVLAFINIYALPADIVKIPGHLGAYATFDISGRKTYRPSFNSCIMRDMQTKEFCSVDKENFWHKFLAQVSLVDELTVQKTSEGHIVNAQTPNLQGLNFTWYKKVGRNFERIDTKNSPTLELSETDHGQYKVEVEFHTPEVRKYNRNFSTHREFSL